MLDGHKLCWGCEATPEDLPLSLDTANTIGPRGADARQAIEYRIASGDKWAWCRVEVRCWVPGFPGFFGADEIRFASFADEAEFVSRSWHYMNLRHGALRQLEASLFQLMQLAAGKLQRTSAEGLKPGDEVFATFLPRDTRYILTVVDPGPDVAAERVKVGAQEVVLSARGGHLPAAKLVLPAAVLTRVERDD